MTIESSEQLSEWVKAINLVSRYFENDISKTVLWFSTPNLLLGDMIPIDMINMGRSKKLLSFIQTALNDNEQFS